MILDSQLMPHRSPCSEEGENGAEESETGALMVLCERRIQGSNKKSKDCYENMVMSRLKEAIKYRICCDMFT